MDKVQLFNIEISSLTLNELLHQLKKGVLFTPNVDHLVTLQKDYDFLCCYKTADWVVCDSRIVNLAAKFLGKGFKEVIPGSSFLPAFYNFHNANKNISIFLLGAAPGVGKVAMQNINEKVGWKIVIGAHSPSFGFEKNENECSKIIDIVNKSGANVLVVGVGAPKQEKWIMKYKSEMSNIDIFMALGATIDFEAGNIKRAPKIIQKFYLEWLYRLMSEPRRLWKRYLIDDFPFFYLILKQKLGLYTDPFK
ncbi:WecB/TagA/CpsF family glycosyltransferase [Aquirufa regiilacus]|uniref:WecB/TagA/CpsF family glycosyltransferase n=1 Tax=Aquirufa regiilacus TaxID=3024868 RepID=A0ABU3TSW5_9BACT|nr:WecB/TagA/CpsF family glycosyltransferase [Aquirufa sp. LEOWEIH-7C]MDU0808899.1 WecB/TagA/CpsF family glycosyltransferase [Aquirufa sp. LEOWEIH-7C]